MKKEGTVNQFPGLTSAEVLFRQQEFGPNQLQDIGGERSIAWFLRHQLANPLLIVLLGAAGLAAALGELLDAIVMVGAVALNVLLGFLQEYKAERTLRALKNLMTPQAWVRRDGKRQRVAAASLVPGDLLLLGAGERVAADASLLETENLELNEAALSGESLGIIKTAGQPLFAGTTILQGSGLGVVSAIGSATRMGQIAHLVQKTERQPTPIEQRLDRLTRHISMLLGSAAGFVLVFALLQGRDLSTALITTIALAIAVIPEGLPIMVTLMLAVGMERLARRQASIRRLDAVETLGSVTVAAIDKTGTLTTGHLRVAEVHGREPGVILTAALLASDVGRSLTGVTDPLEVAIADHALELGIDVATLHHQSPRRAAIPFTAKERAMVTLVGHGTKTTIVAKGAPERIFGQCRLSTAKRATLRREVDRLTNQGLRVLAIAQSHGTRLGKTLPKELTYCGLISFVDPPREDAREALIALQAAGIRPVIITGDHPATARTTAELLGFAVTDTQIITGEELASLSPREQRNRLVVTRICARVSPEQKLLIVEALQAAGEVVAMTGDGINDGPALKKADIGVAMGKSGTEVAKETADLILLDDRLETIVAAVEEGRRIVRNLKKGILYLLGTNGAELLIILIAAGLGWPLPLLATHLLWVNLVADTLPVAGLAFEAAPDVLAYGPTRRTDSLIDGTVIRRIVVMGGLTAAAVLVLFWSTYGPSGDLKTAQTVAFMTLAGVQIANILTVRSLTQLRLPWQHWNGALLIMILLAIGLQATTLFGLEDALHLVPLTGAVWATIGWAIAAVVVLLELHKHLEQSVRPVILRSEARWPKRSHLMTSPEW
ncbi:cation-transporting P-type ATPase [Candidatus Berkelbacteria bacterium]|nr:cation-transporting P-type ATPase [Candidatus Berkelbacteria bacterium]